MEKKYVRLSINLLPPHLPINGHVLSEFKLHHVLPNRLTLILLRLTFTRSQIHTVQPLTPSNRANAHLLFICTNHLSHFSHLVLYGGHSLLIRIISFLVLSLLVWSNFHLIMLIYTTLIFLTCEFLIEQHSVI